MISNKNITIKNYNTGIAISKIMINIYNMKL